jgi:hypothetical protein
MPCFATTIARNTSRLSAGKCPGTVRDRADENPSGRSLSLIGEVVRGCVAAQCSSSAGGGAEERSDGPAILTRNRSISPGRGRKGRIRIERPDSGPAMTARRLDARRTGLRGVRAVRRVAVGVRRGNLARRNRTGEARQTAENELTFTVRDGRADETGPNLTALPRPL